MNPRRTVIRPSAVLTAVAVAKGCGDGGSPAAPPTPEPARPTTVAVSPLTAGLAALGATVRLTAEVRDQDAGVMAGATVTWTSSAVGVATVDASGLVAAAGNGAATVTAGAGSARGAAAVTVMQRVASVSVLPEALTLVAGSSVQLSAEARDANGHAMTGAGFSWASSDTAVATVDASGRVGAVSAGTASVLAASDGIESASRITVVGSPPVRSVEIVSVPTNGGSGGGAGSWELPGRQAFNTTLRAESNPGYDFERWSEGGVTLSTDSVYPMRVFGNHRISAHFSVNQERGRWGPANTYTYYEFPGTGYESLAWTFLPAADPPDSLRRKGLLHYYAYNFGLRNSTAAVGRGYAGFQSNGHMTVGGQSQWGKVVNYSIWGSDAARSEGLINPRNEECRCNQIMLPYEWVEGREYRFELREGPSGVESEGKWWGLWVTDLATDSTALVGEQRVPATIGGRPSTSWDRRTSVFGEDLYFWRSRNGSEKFICSDFEASSLAILDVTAGEGEHRPTRVWTSTSSGKLDVAENGYRTTLCHVTVFQNGSDVQHNVGFWPEPPENVLTGAGGSLR